MLEQLAREGLVKGKTIGIDGTTLEANAALRSLVRREDGQSYHDYLVELAKAEGIEEPTREDIARLDRKRPKKGSNELWVNPHEPDAQISKMKNGSTDMAHKAEHAVDMETGAVVAVTLHGGATPTRRASTRRSRSTSSPSRSRASDASRPTCSARNDRNIEATARVMAVAPSEVKLRLYRAGFETLLKGS